MKGFGVKRKGQKTLMNNLAFKQLQHSDKNRLFSPFKFANRVKHCYNCYGYG